jgi:tetratricopeptide (TPR) repeat protein
LDFEQTGRPAEAVQAYRQAIAIWEKLAADFPDVPEYRHMLARGYLNSGSCLQGMGRLAEAENRYRNALPLWEKLTADQPSVSEYQECLAALRHSLAGLLIRTGRWAEAVQSLRQELTLLESLAQKEPRNPMYQRLLIGLQNSLAWLLATCPDLAVRDATKAVELTEKAVARASDEPRFWNTLGVAYYRAGKWAESIAALEKSMELGKDPNWGEASSDWLFLAMAHWQLGHREQALTWHARAVEWMEKKKSNNDELRRFRAEAEELLGTGAEPKDDCPLQRKD